jgi:Phage protein Gp138 N-terminal domain
MTDLTLSNVLPKVFSSLMRQVHTALLGQVTSFLSSPSPTASVQILTATRLQGVVVKPPILDKVPVLFQVCPLGGLTLDLPVGTKGVLLVCEHALDEVLKFDVPKLPTDSRRYSLSDCLFIPGLVNTPVKSGRLELKWGATSLTMSSEGRLTFGSEAVDVLALISELIGSLLVATAAGSPLVIPPPATQLAVLKAQIDSLKGS